MRQASGLGVALLVLAGGQALAAGNNGPPCHFISWTRTGSMSTPRVGHSAALLPSGKVLVAGGTIDGTAELASAELYDPGSGTWSPTGSMNVPRVGTTLTLLPTGKVLVAGGFNHLEGVTGSAELYDPETGQWTATGSLLEKREGHTATLLSTGQVLVVGGGGVAPGFLASAELYDPASGEWHAAGSLSSERDFHTATLLRSGKVLVLGGFSGPSPTDAADLYDPASGTWAVVTPMLVPRWVHTATLLPSDAVLVAGGAVLGSDGSNPSTEAELRDPATGAWRRTGSMFVPHAQHTATLLPSGRVLAVGGFAAFGTVFNTELFDPDSETWSDGGCTNDPRDEFTTTLLSSGAVLVAGGGVGPHGSIASAELYGILPSPPLGSLAPGATETFSATGGSGAGYVWSFVRNESGGTLTLSGDYRAGPTGGVTDVIQVVDSFANSSTVTVKVVQQQAAIVSPTMPHAKALGCETTGGTALPSLVAILGLLGWRALIRTCRRDRAAPGR
jgi:hypothetical protein